MFLTTSFLRRCREVSSVTTRSFYRGMTVNSASSKASGLTYGWKEGVENIEGYSAGGYHPIQLGDEFFGGRYRVIHKLGQGGSSTVWLARDRAENRYVSLKVITAAASESSSEARIMRLLRQSNHRHQGHSFVVSLLDDFSIDGPNGQHQCIVSELVANSVTVAKKSNKNDVLPLKIALDITPQLSLGLAYIHSCGILHGDIRTCNIAFQFPNIDSWTIEQVHEYFGEPGIEGISRYGRQPLGPEVPPHSVYPAYLGSPGEEGLTKKIKIIDFGEASFAEKPQKELATMIQLQPPETLFNQSVGLPADIWALGCTMFEIFGKTALFADADHFIPSKHDVLLEMVDTLGMLPDRWWKEWDIGHHFFFNDGTRTSHSSYLGEPRSLLDRVSHMRRNCYGAKKEDPEQMSSEDAAGLLKLLISMLEYEPSKRATAEEVVKSEWVQRLLRETGQG
ncbi:hypothetical protein MMC30_007445 [Trapelia coarctata]|nr:hypothetical protein [Trapelia coarctata]